MSTGNLPELLNIQLADDEHKQLWVRLTERAATALDTDPDTLSRPDVLAWAARELVLPDCEHLEAYHMDMGDRTICLRCDGDDHREVRDVELEAAADMTAGGKGNNAH